MQHLFELVWVQNAKFLSCNNTLGLLFVSPFFKVQIDWSGQFHQVSVKFSLAKISLQVCKSEHKLASQKTLFTQNIEKNGLGIAIPSVAFVSIQIELERKYTVLTGHSVQCQANFFKFR